MVFWVRGGEIGGRGDSIGVLHGCAVKEKEVRAASVSDLLSQGHAIHRLHKKADRPLHGYRLHVLLKVQRTFHINSKH